MTKLSWEKSKKKDFLQIVSIKNPYCTKFYADSNANGNDYLYLAFLAQNSEGTVTNKKVTERERYRNE